jgi:hypothetical protein
MVAFIPSTIRIKGSQHQHPEEREREREREKLPCIMWLKREKKKRTQKHGAFIGLHLG